MLSFQRFIHVCHKFLVIFASIFDHPLLPTEILSPNRSSSYLLDLSVFISLFFFCFALLWWSTDFNQSIYMNLSWRLFTGTWQLPCGYTTEESRTLPWQLVTWEGVEPGEALLYLRWNVDRHPSWKSRSCAGDYLWVHKCTGHVIPRRQLCPAHLLFFCLLHSSSPISHDFEGDHMAVLFRDMQLSLLLSP